MSIIFKPDLHETIQWFRLDTTPLDLPCSITISPKTVFEGLLIMSTGSDLFVGKKYYQHSLPHFHRDFCFVLFRFFLPCSNITSVGWLWHSHEGSSMWKIKMILCITCLCFTCRLGDLAHMLLAYLGFLPKKIRHGILPGLTLLRRQPPARTHAWGPGLWRVLG